jgi:Mannose-1-phosphate guanylyltransferase
VERFVEKPDRARARRFVRSGRYLWNAGMFVWRADRFLEELARAAPGIAASVREAASGSAEAWRRAERKSVDYAVMEKARGVKVVPLDAGWDDVGSWDAVSALHEHAPLSGAVAAVDSPGTIALTTGRAVAVIGVRDVIVVETADAVLVVGKGRSEEVRSVLRAFESRGRSDLL